MESKSQARGHFRELRMRASSPDRSGAGQQLLQAPEVERGAIIATFLSYAQEPDTLTLNEQLREQGKRILFPRMNPDKSLLWFEDGEPVESSLLSQIDVFVIPALAIDLRGVRLGQGGGSFDRALANCSGWRVALIDSCCLSTQPLPEESHDIRVDAVATELGITRFR